MHGSVWELCQDWFGAYAAGPATDPVGPAAGEGRVLRGGGWSDFACGLRSTFRFYRAPGYRYGLFGFRLAVGTGPGQARLSGRLAPRGCEGLSPVHCPALRPFATRSGKLRSAGALALRREVAHVTWGG